LAATSSHQSVQGVLYFTTRNTVIECVLSEAVHLEPLLEHISITVQDMNRC
jgi:hypothetical protein